MTGWPVPPAPSAHIQAAALRAAFPQYTVKVIRQPRERPRFELVSRDGGDPYCLISTRAGHAQLAGACDDLAEQVMDDGVGGAGDADRVPPAPVKVSRRA